MVGLVGVFGHCGYMLSMYGTQVGILQEVCHVILGRSAAMPGQCAPENAGYVPHAPVLSQQPGMQRGCLQMRSSVLLWYWNILQRANVPGQYLQGLFGPPFKKSLQGALPLVVGLTQPASP